ncbi:MAG: UDP-glucose/GDP-mannose dehydrogenase family protein [Gemmatimonadales bacterium]|nr:MAG: UDP-glucose/GDP-mannose dehydrogenase family protein [Gemmatimonadales bacterium]
MRIAVIGTGYVGLVTGTGLAEIGNDVICTDIDGSKISLLNEGKVPIFEPGLEPLLQRNLEASRLRFTTDTAEAVRASEIIFIAVGTPPGEDGTADLSHVLGVAGEIGDAMQEAKIVVTKSTVPVGTARLVRDVIESRTEHPVHLASNPEFLKEGAAVDDFMKPDRIVLGVDSDTAREALTELFSPFVRTGNPILVMDLPSAELTKYAANSMLATRISFMNAIASLCERSGADIDAVRAGVGSDPRIGSSFLFPGVGYGGSCFPKDVQALIRSSRELGVDPMILEAVEAVNTTQKRLLLERVVARFGEDLSGRTFALWGLSFKPNTDDMREAPSLVTIEGLLARGAAVRANDPAAIEEARRILDGRVHFDNDNYGVLEGADALLIHTEWLPYRRPDFERIRTLLRRPLIFDGRNIFPLRQMEALGFEYHSVGRPAVVAGNPSHIPTPESE